MMKLLGDVRYCIKVDYFHWNSETDEEYTLPLYWCIDDSPAHIIIFLEEINERLRVFDTEKEANEYLKSHSTGLNVSYENPRVVAIKMHYNKNEGMYEWEEC